MGELIAILSGKGGTGKTSVCAGVATALAQLGEDVLCIDCDIGLRNLDISLGLADSGALSFREVYEGNYDLSQAAVHPGYPKLRFLTAPVSCSPEEINTEAFGHMLRKARSQFTYIFLDAPAGIDAGFRLCASFADRVILVTNSDPASIRDASRTGELLELMGKESVRLVVNRINPKMFDTMDITVDDIMDQAGLPLLGIVPEDEHMVLAATFRKSLLESTKKGAAAACRRIAKRIQGLPIPVSL
ncbi:MAG: P-loop NTPase [Oscillospiraceae bacterium]|nr:P-loop NTPase [Oscillospiraceae bacterium]